MTPPGVVDASSDGHACGLALCTVSYKCLEQITVRDGMLVLAAAEGGEFLLAAQRAPSPRDASAFASASVDDDGDDSMELGGASVLEIGVELLRRVSGTPTVASSVAIVPSPSPLRRPRTVTDRRSAAAPRVHNEATAASTLRRGSVVTMTQLRAPSRLYMYLTRIVHDHTTFVGGHVRSFLKRIGRLEKVWSAAVVDDVCVCVCTLCCRFRNQSACAIRYTCLQRTYGLR